MDIYLDIDGTIKNSAAPIEDTIKLLEFCLNHCHVFWLTTHCRGGENHTYDVLDFLPKSLQERAFCEIGATDWNIMKTDGINFNNKFVWLDDTIMKNELEILEKNNAEQGFFKIEAWDSCCMRDALEYIKKYLAVECGIAE